MRARCVPSDRRRSCAVGTGKRRARMAEALLRFQRVERTQAGGEVAVHPSEPCQARTGGIAGTVGMEQFSGVCLRGTRSGARELSGMEVDHQNEETRNVGGGLRWILHPPNSEYETIDRRVSLLPCVFPARDKNGSLSALVVPVRASNESHTIPRAKYISKVFGLVASIHS